MKLLRAEPVGVAFVLLGGQTPIGIGLPVDGQEIIDAREHQGRLLILQPSLEAAIHPLTEFKQPFFGAIDAGPVTVGNRFLSAGRNSRSTCAGGDLLASLR